MEKVTPNLGETWRADEIYVKFSGKMNYVFAMMDDETRFWIARQVTEKKGTSDVRSLFKQARARVGKKPMLLITDGAPNFAEAVKKEFQSRYADSTNHIRDIRLTGPVHNNKMERMNGEIRQREKVMRGLKKTDSPILGGYQLFHNFVRPHMALDGKSPAEAAGIVVLGDDKWKTLIQNASKKR